MDDVRIIFVLPDKCSDEKEAPDILVRAFEECKQNTDNVVWIKSSEIKTKTLNKTDFVVFEEFTDEPFERLKSMKCARILGPWAIRVCLMESKPIPNYPWPIFNVAMYKYVITCTGLSKDQKRMIKEKVELMGGQYEDSLAKTTTHLIVDKAKSEKYFAATEAGMKLMRSSWVEEVWQMSQSLNVEGDSQKFDNHRCKTFEGLIICSTGLTSDERLKTESLVKQNGGIFSGRLVLAKTDILVCGANATSTEKYKAARQEDIKCVNISWLTESVAKGYALRTTNYPVQKFTSTPTKGDYMANPEYSVLSAIGQPDFSPRPTVEDTFANSSPASNRTAKRKANPKNEYGILLDNLDIKKAKKAGQYLDGCSVYLTGFSLEHVEKLNKILNFSGATRNDKFSDRITHVIVGDSSYHEVNVIRNKSSSCAMVTLQWLLDSIEQARPASEEKYLVDTTSDLDRTAPGSPLSKRGLNLLRSNRTVTEKDMAEVSICKVPVPDKTDDIIQQYLKPNNPAEDDTLAKLLDNIEERPNNINDPPADLPSFQPPNTSTQQSSISVTQDKSSEMGSGIFENMKILIIDDEDYEQIKGVIEEGQGQVITKSHRGIPDYAVFPIFIEQESTRQTAAESVNKLFIYECSQSEELVTDILYYHRPFSTPATQPLKNCVITISMYNGFERMFLNALIEILGGVAQELFARIKNDANGLLASTHLVCPTPKGKKYEGALKWVLPVVSREWLMACLQTGKRVWEGNYLLGDSVAPKRVDLETSNTSADLDKTPAKALGTSIACDNNVRNLSSPARTTSDNSYSKVHTPTNPVTPSIYKRFMKSAEKPFSPVTPVNKILRNFNENVENNSDRRESKDYSLPKPWMNIKTPETPLGAFLTPNPSPGLRKQWEYWLQKFPDKPGSQSSSSTPLSEIKRQVWNKILHSDRMAQPDFNSSQEAGEPADVDMPLENANPRTPENQHLANKLQQLEDMLTASGGSKRQSRNFQSTIPVPVGNREFTDSQPCTVGWDFRREDTPRTKMFSLSGISDLDVRTNMITQIEHLGGLVTELSSYDPSCTHLLCPKPGRNEKTLSCMAAGKWILHTNYLDKSVEAGYFLNEEEYEFGNPKSVGKIPMAHDSESERRMNKMHWWRQEISRRGYGAFNDMRAIVVAQKVEPIARVIEAGGGVVIDVKPPFEDTVHATHCLLEQKIINDFNIYAPLARQGVFVLGTVYISDYLHDPNKDIRDCILPYFSKYFSKSFIE